jgi:LMBR1 domain-containing protein 1
LIPWLNELLIALEKGNAGFIATFVFAYFCLYMLWCVQKGNIKFGIRIPCCCRFHPMKQNETWMNSFLFNVILLLIASAGVIQLCISSFPTYTRNSEIYMIFGVQITYMRFFTAFYKHSVFTIALIIWTFLTLIYQLITCNKKPPYMKDI